MLDGNARLAENGLRVTRAVGPLVRVDSIDVREVSDVGFFFSACQGIRVSQCQARNCGGIGFIIRAGNATTFDGCRSACCGLDGFSVQAGSPGPLRGSGGVNLVNFTSENNFGHGVRLRRTGDEVNKDLSGVNIVNGWFEGNHLDGVYMDAGNCNVT